MNYRVIIVGASTLRGKEIGSALRDRGFPISSLLLLDEAGDTGGDSERKLTEFADEPALLEKPAPDKFEDAHVVFFAGPAAETLKWWKPAWDRGALVIDLSNALGLEARAELIAGVGSQPHNAGRLLELRLGAVAHPAAQYLARMLRAFSSVAAPTLSVATIFEPVSERGMPGIHELQQQTQSLLSFKPMPSEIYGGQVAFNLRASLGEEVRPSLADIEALITLHLRQLIGEEPLRTAAVRVLQAPVFHSHSVSLFVRFADDPARDALEAALRAGDISRSQDGEDEPDVLRAAGEEQFQVGALRPDRNVAGGYWIFATFDGLRIASLTAVDGALSFLSERARAVS